MAMTKWGALFEAKHPYTTWAVRVDAPDGDDIAPLVQAFSTRGWTHETTLPPVSGRRSHWFFKSGTGLFRGWTPGEATANMREARTVLRQFGWTKVPKRRLRLEDLL